MTRKEGLVSRRKKVTLCKVSHLPLCQGYRNIEVTKCKILFWILLKTYSRYSCNINFIYYYFIASFANKYMNFFSTFNELRCQLVNFKLINSIEKLSIIDSINMQYMYKSKVLAIYFTIYFKLNGSYSYLIMLT